MASSLIRSTGSFGSGAVSCEDGAGAGLGVGCWPNVTNDWPKITTSSNNAALRLSIALSPFSFRGMKKQTGQTSHTTTRNHCLTSWIANSPSNYEALRGFAFTVRGAAADSLELYPQFSFPQ